MVPKWERNIRKRQEVAEVILPRPADNRRARKSQANQNTPRGAVSNSDRNAEKGRRNGSVTLTFVLAVEQLFQFLL
jgi:hypothetical protein